MLFLKGLNEGDESSEDLKTLKNRLLSQSGL